MTEQVSVEQCDREAAAKWLDSIGSSKHAKWLRGQGPEPHDLPNQSPDQHSLVQAFARHRLAALAQSDATLRAEVERFREALENIEQGDVPRPVGQVYRRDGKPSKLDQCIHRVAMYDDCGNCIANFARAALDDFPDIPRLTLG